MGIEQEISEILKESEASNLSRNLLERLGQLPPPSREERDAIARILEDVASDLPLREAMWVAFWLGSSWQSLRE